MTLAAERDKEAKLNNDAASSHVLGREERHDGESSSAEMAQIAEQSVTFDDSEASCPKSPVQVDDGAEHHQALAGWQLMPS